MYNSLFAMLERYTGDVEKRLRIGADVRLEKPIMIGPHEAGWAKLSLDGNSFPVTARFGGNSHMYNCSLRSRIAQGGMDLTTEANEIINGNRQADEIVLPVVNRGNRLLILPEGMGFIRIHRDDGKLKGDRIRSMLGREIRITGPRKLVLNDESEFDTIDLWLDPESRSQLKPTGRPLRVKGNMQEVRDAIDKESEEISQSEMPTHYNADTMARLTLVHGVHAIIAGAVYYYDEQRIVRDGDEIFQSRFIDGGSNWPIRAEFFTPTLPEAMPNAIALKFVLNI